ncbi:MAG: holo-ACP synthase [Candidatus Caldatribacteriota bacterium]|nr:holo-ACP synthase [Candidatus Caldatribacteriota bacterium]
MIIGCGIDLVGIKRIEKIINKWGDNFVDRIFTPLERQYCKEKKNGFQSYAGRFAAKEAMLKALGLGLSRVGWKEIEVINNRSGQPIMKLSGKLKGIASEKGVDNIFVTISHTKEFAIAQVILERINNN